MKEKEKDIRTNIILPESMWVRLKILAVSKRVPFTEIARRALGEYLAREEPEKGRNKRLRVRPTNEP